MSKTHTTIPGLWNKFMPKGERKPMSPMTLLQWAPFNCYLFSASLVELKFHISYYYSLIPQFYSGLTWKSWKVLNTLWNTLLIIPTQVTAARTLWTWTMWKNYIEILKGRKTDNLPGLHRKRSADKISATLQKNSSSTRTPKFAWKDINLALLCLKCVHLWEGNARSPPELATTYTIY